MENQGMLALVELMSDDDLIALKSKYPGNKSIEDLVKGILDGRSEIKRKAELKGQFEEAVRVMASGMDVFPNKGKDTKAIHIGLPMPPEGIYNVHFAWSEVVRDDTTKPQTEVEVVKDGQKVKEARYPQIKVWEWVVSTNKAQEVVNKLGTEAKAGKRSIQVFKLDKNTMKVESKGKFSAGSVACKHLNIDPGQGSANLALTKAGYIVESYEGTDLIA